MRSLDISVLAMTIFYCTRKQHFQRNAGSKGPFCPHDAVEEWRTRPTSYCQRPVYVQLFGDPIVVDVLLWSSKAMALDTFENKVELGKLVRWDLRSAFSYALSVRA